MFLNIVGFAFSPAEYSVPLGTRVTWTNQDTIVHTVTSTDAPELFNSGNLTGGQTFSLTFKTPGTYNYTCAYHPSMLGKVIIQR